MKNILSKKSSHATVLRTIYFVLFTLYFSFSYAQPGALDSSFAENGKKIEYPDGGSYIIPYKLAVQSTGKIILGGASGSQPLRRYFPDGSQDNSFGVGQKYYVNAISIFIQKDDKIVIADESQIFRFMPDGAPDSSFAVNGVYLVPPEDSIGFALDAVAVDAKGRIVAGGTHTKTYSWGNYANYAYAIRLTPDGKLDETFGNNGSFIADDGTYNEGFINNMAIGKNGKIALVGLSDLVNPDSKVFVVMLTPDGKFDSSFKGSSTTFEEYGYTYTNIDAGAEEANNVIVKDDGKILVTGSCRLYAFKPTMPEILLVQYNPDGTLDKDFGKGGFTEAAVYDQCYGNDMAMQQNGKIVITGQCIKKSGASDFVISRFLPNGIIDSAFGLNGFNVTDFGFDEFAKCTAIKKDGNIVAAGYTTLQLDEDPDILMSGYIGDPVKPAHPLITKIKTCIRRHILNFSDTNPNTAYYTIEQQTSNGTYKQIASLNASSANQYSYSLPPSTNETTYRVKAVSKDNSFTYTQPIQDISDDAASISVSPNPATNTINISGLISNKNYDVKIVNKQGLTVSSVIYHLSSVNSKINVAFLDAGVYFIEVKDSEGNISSLKFVKQ